MGWFRLWLSSYLFHHAWPPILLWSTLDSDCIIRNHPLAQQGCDNPRGKSKWTPFALAHFNSVWIPLSHGCGIDLSCSPHVEKRVLMMECLSGSTTLGPVYPINHTNHLFWVWKVAVPQEEIKINSTDSDIELNVKCVYVKPFY